MNGKKIHKRSLILTFVHSPRSHQRAEIREKMRAKVFLFRQQLNISRWSSDTNYSRQQAKVMSVCRVKTNNDDGKERRFLAKKNIAEMD